MSEGSEKKPLWDPFGVWKQVGQAADRALQGELPMLSQTPLQGLIESVRSRLLGRRLTLTLAGQQVAFDLTDIAFDSDPFLMAAGQVKDVQVSVGNLVWGQHRFDSAGAVLHNVHTRAGTRPRLVSAPIDLHLRITEDRLADLVASKRPGLKVEIANENTVRIRPRRRPRLGWAEVTFALDAGRVLAVPVTLALGTWRWRFPRRTKPIPLRFELPPDVRLTGIDVVPQAVELRLRIDQRHLDYRGSHGVCHPVAPTRIR